MPSLITTVPTPAEARSLPRGSVVGDLHGGVTFSDAVAAVLEARSHQGWREVDSGVGSAWTVIVLNR